MSIPLLFSAVFSGANAIVPTSAAASTGVSPYKHQALLWSGWGTPEDNTFSPISQIASQNVVPGFQSPAPNAALNGAILSQSAAQKSEATASMLKMAGATKSWIA